MKKSREFQVFVKPVGALCNLKCSYCYYLDKKDIYQGTGRFLMTDDMLEQYIIQHIEASTEESIFFSWHGGEPLLAGIDFYSRALALQKKYKPESATIFNGIQTNGTLLDDEWCRFLSNENFIIGISIDGPPELHNQFRRSSKGEDTFLRVVKGYELLKKYGNIPEILCVVNAVNVKNPVEIYELFRNMGAKYISFLPLVERSYDAPSGVTPNSVPSLEFGVFLSSVFDSWVEKDIGDIKIQIIEEAARTAFNQGHTLCIFKEKCGGVPVIEHNGDFYSCDHYVDQDYLLGNLADKSLSWLLDSEEQQAFGQAKKETLPAYCRQCEVLSMCNGECPKNRFTDTPDGEPGLNYLCAGYKYFFYHVRPFVDEIAEAFRNQGG